MNSATPDTSAVSPQDIAAYRRRWEVMRELELEELRNSSPETCLNQLEALYASVDVLGLREALAEGEQAVRERWIRLKNKYGVRR